MNILDQRRLVYRVRRISQALLYVVALQAGLAFGADWPQFRGPLGDGVSPAKDVPIEWSTTENVAWKQPVPGSGWSSPVVTDASIYLTTAFTEENGQVSLNALCVDANTGGVRWNTAVFRPSLEATKQVHQKNSLASATPLIQGDRLFVHFGHMGTAALDLDGNVLWRQSDLVYKPVHGNGGSPAAVDDKIVFSCDAADDPFVAALDRETGAVRWKVPRNTTAKKTFSFSTPTIIEVEGQTQIISQGSGLVGAYDPDDGREIWRVRYGEGYSVVPRPVYSHGLLFLATGFNRAVVYAIDPKSATGDVTATHVRWTHDKGAPLTPSLLVAGDEIYFVSDNGVATCLDARTGASLWTKRLGGDFSASPLFAEGRVYFLSEGGVMSVVEAAKEFKLLATNALDEQTLASPAVINGAIIVRSERHLHRLENAAAAAGN